jgi:nitroreductase
VLHIIRRRRSIRKFKPQTPTVAEVHRILEAGRWAPSGLNNQPWRFCILMDPDIKNALARHTRYGWIIRKAPVVLAIFLDTADSYNRDKDIMAIGACIQNILLEAHSLKLGGCWLGEILHHKQSVQKLLRVGNDLELMAVICVGWPAGPKLRGQRKNIKELVIASPTLQRHAEGRFLRRTR